jgi:hypothetical protein
MKFLKATKRRKINKHTDAILLDHGVEGGGGYVFGAFYLMPSSCMVV